jgi:hypothetical protein
VGADVAAHWIGQRVGVPWLGWTCGQCEFCLSGRENLCDKAQFTGCHLDGGYAEYTVADERFCFPIPQVLSDIQAAPLLCAGLIGFRALQMAGARATWASTGSVRRRIWRFRWRGPDKRCTPLPDRMTMTVRLTPDPWGPNGRGHRINRHRTCSTPA